MQRVRHHREIQAGIVERQRFGCCVDGADFEPPFTRLRSQPIQHRLRRLDGADVESPLGQWQRHMPDPCTQIPHPPARGQRRQRIDQPKRVRGPRIVDVGHAVENPSRGIIESDLATTEAHGGPW